MADYGETVFWKSYYTVGPTAAVVVGLVCTGLFLLSNRKAKKLSDADDEDSRPLSVNYHFTRRCNYQCGFCFHTAKTSFVLPIDEAKRGLKMLKETGKPHPYSDL